MADIADICYRIADTAINVLNTVPGYPNPQPLTADPFQPSDVSSAQLPFWIITQPPGMNSSDIPISAGQQYISTKIDMALCVVRREGDIMLQYSVLKTLQWRKAVYQAFSPHVRLSDPARIILTATNASPIQVTTAIPHRYVNGDAVTITGVVGNTNANNAWIVTVVDYLNFTLNGSTGNGAGTGGTTRKTQPFDLPDVVDAVISSWGLVPYSYGTSEFLAILFKLNLREMYVTSIAA